MEVSGQLHAPAALPPGNEPPITIGQEVGWASELMEYTLLILLKTKRSKHRSLGTEKDEVSEFSSKFVLEQFIQSAPDYMRIMQL
jgi:hypothetical protein